MTKPDDVSEEAWGAAQDICDQACLPEHYYIQGVVSAMQSSIARAIDGAKAEQREADAKVAERYVLTSNSRDIDVAVQETVMAETADKIVRAIRGTPQ